MCHGQHAADIFGRLRKTFAAGFVHVELAEQCVAVAQAIQFAEHDLGGIVREHEPGIMLDEVEPAAAGGVPQKIRAARQKLRHRMVEAAHQRAVDEETI